MDMQNISNIVSTVKIEQMCFLTKIDYNKFIKWVYNPNQPQELHFAKCQEKLAVPAAKPH